MNILKRQTWLNLLKSGRLIAEQRDPFERYMAPARMMEGFSSVNEQRGCRFLNMAAEIPDSASCLRHPGVVHYNAVRALLKDLTRALKESDLQRYGHLHVDLIADHYLLLIAGGLTMAELYDDLWPARYISNAVEQLVHSRGALSEGQLSAV